MNNKKFLIITPRFPYPVIGGDRLRIYQICKALSAKYELHLISLCESQDEMAMTIPNDGVFHQVHRVYMSKWRSRLNCLRALFSNTPLQVAYYKSQAFSEKISALNTPYDVVLAHLVRTAEYAKQVNAPTKVLEMTDAISLNYARVREQGSKFNFKHLVYAIEQKRLQAYEKKVVEHFTMSMLVSKIDADYLFSPSAQQNHNVVVCSNGVDTDALAYNFHGQGRQIVFIGNMYSAQNLDAALWFAKSVMAQLRKHAPFTFKAVGKIRPSDQAILNAIPGVTATGLVDDVAAHVRGSVAAVCSVRLGAGVQNKVLEYMSLGIPCVSTTVGAEGFQITNEKELLIADSAEAFVTQILSLHQNPQSAEAISKHGREYVEKHHSWYNQLAMLNEYLKTR